MRRRQRITRALLFIAGLGIGIGLGLGISWGLLPRSPTYANLSQLQTGYKEDFILMTSVAYAQDGDLELAKERLSLLGEEDIPQWIAGMAERAISAGASPLTRRGLARLAFALGERSGAIMAYVATPIRTATATVAPPLEAVSVTPVPTLRATPTASATPSPRPTRAAPTPTRAQVRPPGTGTAATYVLTGKEYLVGADNVVPGQILITVLTPEGKGLAGIRVRIEWDGGSDVVVTGLHPDKGAGYADLAMAPGRTYTAFVMGAQSESASGLTASAAGSSEGALPGSWRVVFSRLP